MSPTSILKNLIKRFVLAPYLRLTLRGKIRIKSPLWVHFGCGNVADARFLNVDARYFRHIDYVTKSPAMPAVPTGCADLIYACHVFEHVSHLKQGETLARWHAILKPGGKLMLSVPDLDKLILLYLSSNRDVDVIQPPLMGGQEYDGNFHYAVFSQDHLSKLLTAAGFTDVQTWRSEDQDNWPRDWSWDQSVSLNLLAVKR